MTVKELIEKLSAFDGNMKIQVNTIDLTVPEMPEITSEIEDVQESKGGVIIFGKSNVA